MKQQKATGRNKPSGIWESREKVLQQIYSKCWSCGRKTGDKAGNKCNSCEAIEREAEEEKIENKKVEKELFLERRQTGMEMMDAQFEQKEEEWN